MSDARSARTAQVSQFVAVCVGAFLGQLLITCISTSDPGATVNGNGGAGGSGDSAATTTGGTVTATTSPPPPFGGVTTGSFDPGEGCGPVKTCAELGWACGYT